MNVGLYFVGQPTTSYLCEAGLLVGFSPFYYLLGQMCTVSEWNSDHKYVFVFLY